MVNKKILYIGIFLLINLLTFVIADDPPDFPIKIYGKVVNKDGNVISGVAIRVIYTDNSGAIQSRAFKDLNEKPGYYSFEVTGAKTGTKITISSFSSKKEIDVSYGLPKEFVLEISNIDIRNLNNKNSSRFKPSSSIGAIANLLYNLFNKKDNSFSFFPDNNITNATNSILNNSNDNITIKNKTDFNKTNENEIIDKKINESNFGNINAINGGSSLYSQNQTDTGGENNDNFVPEYSIEGYEKYESSLKQDDEIMNKTSGKSYFINIFNYKESENPYIYLFVSILFFIIVGFLVGIIFIIKSSLNIHSGSYDKELKVSINNMSKLESKRFMVGNAIYLNSESNILDAIDLFIDNNLSIIPILSSSKKVLGVITKRYLLNINFDFYYLQNTKITTIMDKKYISSGPDDTMGDLYTKLLQTKSNSIIIEDEKKFLGTVDFFDLLKVFNSSNFSIENPLVLSQSMDKDVKIIEYEADLEALRKKFLNENTDYCVVMRDNNIVGIVTTKDLLSAIRKNMDLNKFKLEMIMTHNVISMTPGTNIYEAFKIMLDRRYNQIPIISVEGLAGIINIKYLVKLYYEFISDLFNKMDKKTSKDLIKRAE